MKAETEHYLTECGLWNNIPNVTMTMEKLAEMLEEYHELQLRKGGVIRSLPLKELKEMMEHYQKEFNKNIIEWAQLRQ